MLTFHVDSLAGKELNRVQGATSLQTLEEKQQIPMLDVNPQKSVDLNAIRVVRIHIVGLVIPALPRFPSLDMHNITIADLLIIKFVKAPFIL